MATTTDGQDQEGAQQQTRWVCDRCRDEISPAAEVCPQCGYKGTPSIRERLGFARRRMAILGWTATIIGIPMAIRRWRQYKARKADFGGGPAVPADE